MKTSLSKLSAVERKLFGLQPIASEQSQFQASWSSNL